MEILNRKSGVVRCNPSPESGIIPCKTVEVFTMSNIQRYQGHQEVIDVPYRQSPPDKWIAWEGLCKWAIGMRYYPFRSSALTIGSIWVSLFIIFAGWNAIFSKQRVANADPFNPMQAGWFVGGSFGTAAIDAGNTALTPTMASFVGENPTLSPADLRRQNRRGSLQTVSFE